MVLIQIEPFYLMKYKQYNYIYKFQEMQNNKNNKDLWFLPEDNGPEKSQNYTNNINNNITVLAQCINQLKNEISLLSKNKAQEPGESQFLKAVKSIKEEVENEELQERFKKVNIAIPKINNIKTVEGVKALKKWLGFMIMKIFSHSFNLLQSEKLDKNKTRSFCCQNTLFCIIQIIRVNNFGEDQIQLINNCLKDELLPYLILKYPKSEQKQINLSLMKVISSVDNLESNENDLIYRSGVKFEYHENGNYNKKIMQFLNFVINLPNKCEQVVDKHGVRQQKSLADCFSDDMENLFKRIEDQNEVRKMKIFDKEDPQNIDNFDLFGEENQYQPEKSQITEEPLMQSEDWSENQSFVSTSQKVFQYGRALAVKNYKQSLHNCKQTKQYSQQVKQYSQYLIGRKISKNIQKFEPAQLEDENLQIKESSLSRILTKWCQELEKKFKNTENKEEPFRMLDGSEKYLKKEQQIILSQLLQKQKEKIDKTINKIMKNNYEQQEILSKDKIYEQFEHFSEFQSTVGLFSAFVDKNNIFYLISYLNALIHGLLTVSKEYTTYVVSNMQKWYYYNPSEPVEDLIEKCQKYIEDFKYEYSESHKSSIPTLISFNIGDLLRCKCSSKQYEITALFNELERIDYWEPETLKIIRVKNKLNEETKDILINLLYRNKIVIEMQLAVKTQKSQFLKFSDKFNHFIYQLQRAKFGPIAELCKIWMVNDPKEEFYKNKIRAHDIFEKAIHHGKFGCQIIKKQENLPFKCQYCFEYKNDIIYEKKHFFCKTCNKNICFRCVIKGVENYDSLRLIEPQLPALDDALKYIISKPQSYKQDEIPETGILIHLKSKKLCLKKYKKIENNKQIYIFSINTKKQLTLEAQLRKPKQIKQFLKNNIIMIHEDIKKEVEDISIDNLQQSYFIPKLFEKYHKNQKESVMAIKLDLKDSKLLGFKSEYKQFNKAKNVSFIENYLESFENIPELFPKAQKIVLSFNMITQVTDNIQRLKRIKFLYLDNNKIKQISPNIKELKELKVLSLSHNYELQKLPRQIIDLQEIQELNFSHTSITQYPEKDIDDFKIRLNWKRSSNSIRRSNEKKYKNLQIKKKRSSQAPSVEEFDHYKNLKILDLSHTKLKFLPNSMGFYKNLQKLNLTKTKQLEELPESMGRCNKLRVLKLYESNVKKIPQSLSLCQYLQKLDLGLTNIKKLPHNIGDLKCLKELDLMKTSLQELPQSIGFCSKIQKLILSDTSISKLPQSLARCSHLVELVVNECNVQKLPDKIGSCRSLKKLNISYTLIHQFPQSIGNCFHLRELNCKRSKLKTIPETIEKCKNLRILDLSYTELEKIPDTIGECKDLRQLNLKKTRIVELPPSIGMCHNLQKIDVSFTQIICLPKSLQKCLKLKQVNQLLSRSADITSIIKPPRKSTAKKIEQIQNCSFKFEPNSQKNKLESRLKSKFTLYRIPSIMEVFPQKEEREEDKQKLKNKQQQ